MPASGEIDNQPSIERLAELWRCLPGVQQGADCIAPSGHDGRAHRRHQAGAHASTSLDHRTTVCSYAVKFAIRILRPLPRRRRLRRASPATARATNCRLMSRGLAIRAVDRDVEEGADLVMVKPAGPYLDLVRDVKERVQRAGGCVSRERGVRDAGVRVRRRGRSSWRRR